VTPWLQPYAFGDFVFHGGHPTADRDYHSLGAGINVLPFRWNNRWKASIEGGYLFSDISRTIVPASDVLGFLPTKGAGQFYFRTQLQLGF